MTIENGHTIISYNETKAFELKWTIWTGMFFMIFLHDIDHTMVNIDWNERWLRVNFIILDVNKHVEFVYLVAIYFNNMKIFPETQC